MIRVLLALMVSLIGLVGCQSTANQSVQGSVPDAASSDDSAKDILDQARALHVQRLVLEGQRAARSGDNGTAQVRFEKALDLDPGNTAAIDGLRLLPATSSLLDGVLAMRTNSPAASACLPDSR